MDKPAFERLVERQINRGHVYNIVVGAQMREGSVDLRWAAGRAGADEPMTVDTPYFLASITKMYTAAVIILLHEGKKLDLEDPISKHLPQSLIDGIHRFKGHDYGGQIQIYQLVNQTSGLPDYFLEKPKGGRTVLDELRAGHDRAYDVEEVVEIARQLSPKFAPGENNGTRAHYADTNYQLLGAIIQAVTGQPVAAAYQEMITEPLGLTHTYPYEATLEGTDRAPATVYDGAKAIHIPKFMSSHTPDGGLVANLSDSLTFLHAFLAGDLFDASWHERLQQWNPVFFPLQYGYGMMRFKLPRFFWFRPLPELIGHAGSTGSFAFYCPQKDAYFAGTVNQLASPSRPFRFLMKLAMEL